MADRTESSIRIDAPPADVLAVVSDLQTYPDWADGITEVAVLSRRPDGLPAQARFAMSSGPVRDSLLLQYVWDTAEDGSGTVSWSLAEPGAMTKVMDGSYELAGDGSRTEVTYRLAVEVGVLLPGLLRRKAERTIVDAALLNLKARVEG